MRWERCVTLVGSPVNGVASATSLRPVGSGGHVAMSRRQVLLCRSHAHRFCGLWAESAVPRHEPGL